MPDSYGGVLGPQSKNAGRARRRLRIERNAHDRDARRVHRANVQLWRRLHPVLDTTGGPRVMPYYEGQVLFCGFRFGERVRFSEEGLMALRGDPGRVGRVVGTSRDATVVYVMWDGGRTRHGYGVGFIESSPAASTPSSTPPEPAECRHGLTACVICTPERT